MSALLLVSGAYFDDDLECVACRYSVWSHDIDMCDR